MKENKLIKVVLPIFLSVIILFFMFALFFFPKKEFSENENRYLQDMPKFTVKALFDGKFIPALEDYFKDHFAFRDMFVGGKAMMEKLLGKTENNGVYFAKNGYLIQKYSAPSLSSLDRLANSVNRFVTNAQIPTTFLLAPTSNFVNEDLLPKNHVDANQKGTIDYFYGKLLGVDTLDVSETLLSHNEAEQLYFRLDHHWNGEGAYYAYVAFCKSLGIEAKSLAEFDRVLKSNNFNGTMYSQSGYYFNQPDELYYYLPKFEEELTVTYVASNRVVNTLYEEKWLDQKDKYASFLDNNHPLITIENAKAESEETLLLVKDSYANIFVPFLTSHFKTIHVIDLRFNNSVLSEYVKMNEIDRALFLYNAQGIADDVGLGKAK